MQETEQPVKYEVKYNGDGYSATAVVRSDEELNDMKRHFNRRGFEILSVSEVEKPTTPWVPRDWGAS